MRLGLLITTPMGPELLRGPWAEPTIRLALRAAGRVTVTIWGSAGFKGFWALG